MNLLFMQWSLSCMCMTRYINCSQLLTKELHCMLLVHLQDLTDEPKMKLVLIKWSRMHLVRTALSCTSFAVMIATLARTSQRS